MRVLIVAPEQPGIYVIPEVRAIQTWHHTTLLHGPVTVEDIVNACLATKYDIIHFATHGGPDGLQLSNGELMTAYDIARVARLQNTPELFFNACDTGSLAARAVRNGPKYAYSAEIALEDDEAWKFPYAFYSIRRNGHANDPVGAFLIADVDDGVYAMHVSPSYIKELQSCVTQVALLPYGMLTIGRRELIVLLVVFLLISVILSYMLLRTSGIA